MAVLQSTLFRCGPDRRVRPGASRRNICCWASPAFREGRCAVLVRISPTPALPAAGRSFLRPVESRAVIGSPDAYPPCPPNPRVLPFLKVRPDSVLEAVPRRPTVSGEIPAPRSARTAPCPARPPSTVAFRPGACRPTETPTRPWPGAGPKLPPVHSPPGPTELQVIVRTVWLAPGQWGGGPRCTSGGCPPLAPRRLSGPWMNLTAPFVRSAPDARWLVADWVPHKCRAQVFPSASLTFPRSGSPPAALVPDFRAGHGHLAMSVGPPGRARARPLAASLLLSPMGVTLVPRSRRRSSCPHFGVARLAAVPARATRSQPRPPPAVHDLSARNGGFVAEVLPSGSVPEREAPLFASSDWTLPPGFFRRLRASALLVTASRRTCSGARLCFRVRRADNWGRRRAPRLDRGQSDSTHQKLPRYENKNTRQPRGAWASSACTWWPYLTLTYYTCPTR